jgi:abnormal spindle-like microcephaly-associated protein
LDFRFFLYKINFFKILICLKGARIRTSLGILRHPNHPIQLIMHALTDLDRVTKLSPECCAFFVRERAVDTLYTFILNCNRSVPHMDLVKLCLQVLINLAKYARTQEHVVVRAGGEALSIFMNLLQAYYVSNAHICMSVCVLLIVLVDKYEESRAFVFADKVFVKKLEQIHSTLERRAQFTASSNVPQQTAATGHQYSDQVCAILFLLVLLKQET